MPSLRRIIPGLIPPAFIVLAFVVNSMDEMILLLMVYGVEKIIMRGIGWGVAGGDMCAVLYDPV